MKARPLGWGAAPIGFLKTGQRAVDGMIAMLRDAGLEVIDTAAAYQNSESLLGRALRGCRDDFILIGKCGGAMPELPGDDWSAEAIHAAAERSLRRLGTDRLDVLLLHSCGLEVLENGEAVTALMDLKREGKDAVHRLLRRQ